MLGLLAGVVGVVLIAVVYYHKSTSPAATHSLPPSTEVKKLLTSTPAAAMPVEPVK